MERQWCEQEVSPRIYFVPLQAPLYQQKSESGGYRTKVIIVELSFLQLTFKTDDGI